jgi:hypothetical protein
MRIEVCVRTGKGHRSTEQEVKRTVKELMRIAKDIRGSVVDGNGFSDGAKLIIEND